jgi:hypothetical protein
MFNNAISLRVTATINRIYQYLTAHHPLHKTEHIGAFAGSYLSREDWDHQ